MEHQDQLGGWVVVVGLDEERLIRYITENSIKRDQVIAVTEPEKGRFTLICEGTAEQHRAYMEEKARRAEAWNRLVRAQSASISRG